MTAESVKEEILINVTPNEVRAAILENGVVQEVHIERATQRQRTTRSQRKPVSATSSRKATSCSFKLLKTPSATRVLD